jgi:hypothetical protein
MFTATRTMAANVCSLGGLGSTTRSIFSTWRPHSSGENAASPVYWTPETRNTFNQAMAGSNWMTGVQFPTGIFLFKTTIRHLHWTPGINRLELKDDYSPSPTAEAKNTWSFTSTPRTPSRVWPVRTGTALQCTYSINTLKGSGAKIHHLL